MFVSYKCLHFHKYLWSQRMLYIIFVPAAVQRFASLIALDDALSSISLVVAYRTGWSTVEVFHWSFRRATVSRVSARDASFWVMTVDILRRVNNPCQSWVILLSVLTDEWVWDRKVWEERLRSRVEEDKLITKSRQREREDCGREAFKRTSEKNRE